MTQDKICNLAALRALLFQMECDLGLAELSEVQRDVFYAAKLTYDRDRGLRSKELRQHPLVENIPHATFFRALTALIGMGLIERKGDDLVVLADE